MTEKEMDCILAEASKCDETRMMNTRVLDIDDAALKDVLGAISGYADDYHSWVKVGMALKSAGQPLEIWDAWSAQGSTYRNGECEKKWNSFQKDGVGMGSLVYLARQASGNHELGKPKIDIRVRRVPMLQRTAQPKHRSTPQLRHGVLILESRK